MIEGQKFGVREKFQTPTSGKLDVRDVLILLPNGKFQRESGEGEEFELPEYLVVAYLHMFDLTGMQEELAV